MARRMTRRRWWKEEACRRKRQVGGAGAGRGWEGVQERVGNGWRARGGGRRRMGRMSEDEEDVE